MTMAQLVTMSPPPPAPPPPVHNYSPLCRLRPLSPPENDGNDDEVPRIATQFFYSSPIPIDDPLSAAIATIPDANNPAHAVQNLRAFSEGDNLALERAWLGFGNHDSRAQHERQVRRYKLNKNVDEEEGEVRKRVEGVVERLARVHVERHKRESGILGRDGGLVVMMEGGGGGGGGGLEEEKVVCCQELGIDVAGELRKEFCGLVRRRVGWLGQERVVEGVMAVVSKLQGGQDAIEGGQQGKKGGGGSRPQTPVPQMVVGSVPRVPGMSGIGVGEDLLRGVVGDREREGRERGSGIATPDDRGTGGRRGDSTAGGGGPRIAAGAAVGKTAPPPEEDAAEVPVGIQRLHMVSLPVLQMKPIYWSPVNDIATVVRATWFYRDTMIPLPPLIANQLEAGYRELRPWTQTWSDELRSALDVGAVGEEKVTHRLWPESLPEKQTKASKSKDGQLLPPEPPISSDPFCAARCFGGEAAAEGKLDPVHEETDTAIPAPEQRQYENYHVIYKNKTEAFLLKPSQQPSAYYSRRPVQKIMKGVTVGVPVVRGFDRQAWEKVHEKKKGQQQAQNKQQTARQDHREHREGVCQGCQEEMQRGQVTDLVLIAHGIGQKFAERVESFHFTHAVNAFRRMVNVELETPAVKSVLRPEQNGIMVLPVNWRHLLSFEDGGPTTGNEEDKAAYAPDGFGLKDIEPTTIPAVRSMISDVMFDIPFYMSHHKPKMIAALVGEANRVYRLWCGNNPGFAEKGRVHLIGHSLGSAMAVEVLSKQPTRVPRPLDLSVGPDKRFFEFDTTNLFLLGSPAAFFLLLERGGLIPRRGRMKPGAEAADTVAKDVVGDVGMFGCIAVDNIYNILAKEDPIAYLLNGTVDPAYAAGLRTAYVPSLQTGFLKGIGDALRGVVGGGSGSGLGDAATLTGPGEQQKKPGSMMMRLPSQLELEVHDFTREDIAEKKAFLLNDNGQIDYYLRSGGGPLEIQYLNMLSAHTSYWTNLDLMRFLCIEVGRRPGRKHTLPAMRAVKVKGRFGGVQVGGGGG
ncbi:putative phospholipase [Triangularia verruculosa]|uniref:Phospholipase n=1 Tax=Triangularia verruculosa TaxID=2587418 RepID=A0AAN6XSB8_9PEZI|nr:putative phospholipase [Triangularia verruculosa]